MKRIFGLTGIAVLCGCTLATVQVDVLSERTALENQVLGSYNALDAQMLLSASVRGVDASGNLVRPPARSREREEAILAMQTVDFHEDDLERFKRLGWAGENNRGLLEAFSTDRTNTPDSLKEFAEQISDEEFAAIVSSVNAARETIMLQVIYMNEDLTENDLATVEKIFAKRNAEQARPGDKIQDETGNWLVKQASP